MWDEKKCSFLEHLPGCKGKKQADNFFNKKVPYLLVSFQIHFGQKAHILTYSYILLYIFF